jgi:exodeoxyribonuclease V alpha subunit
MVTFKGQLDRIRFRNEKSGYTIALFNVDDSKDNYSVTVVGNLPHINIGETLNVTGEWTTHPKYGKQLLLRSYENIIPATIEGMLKYLGSGMIKGIGPVYSQKIIDKFGLGSIDIIEKEPHRLAEIGGFGEKRIETIKQSWESQRDIKNVMVFLQGHGITPAYATKIYRQYKSEAVKIVSENPYKLTYDIFGIGFKTADKIAQNIGIPKDSVMRAEAGVLYVLEGLADQGHVYYPYSLLINESNKLLEIDHKIIQDAIDRLLLEKKLAIEKLPFGIGEIVYLSRFYMAEVEVAKKICRLIQYPKSINLADIDLKLREIQRNSQIAFSNEQIYAIQSAIKNKMLIITGGPGVGKSTITKAIVSLYKDMGDSVLIAAPTGRAAKRITETSGHEAKTMHRLLEYSPQEGKFRRNENNTLKCDIAILDETSMIPAMLMYHFMKALPEKSTLIMIGDVDQLPAVGAGNVLKDLIASDVIPTVRLTKIFRQSETSYITTNAHMINTGRFPNININRNDADFLFIEKESPEQALSEILSLVTDKIPQKYGFDPFNDIQVLTPMHKGVIGTENLNMVLQKSLNKEKTIVTKGFRTFKLKDKVMQIKNNYDKDVFNGDIGFVSEIDEENQEIAVSFDSRPIKYEFTDIDELTLAYSCSIHKSQGSEFPVIVMPVMTTHYIMLQRNLIYTGITRGKKLVVIVGTKKALAIAVRNNKPVNRHTLLSHRIRNIKNKQ